MRVIGVMFSPGGAVRVDRSIPMADLEAQLNNIARILAGQEGRA